jgi:aminodeoxyfutalosine deaminase
VATLYRAAWVLPIASPPVPNGWVHVAAQRVRAVGAAGDEPPGEADVVDLGHVALLPGLVNAHTHLELSWMQGRVPPSEAMPAWAAALMALRGSVDAQPDGPIEAAVREARAAGTSVVGDVTNTLAAYGPLLDSELAAAVFREVLGFNTEDPARVVESVQRQMNDLLAVAWLRPAIVPHAPYSVSPDLFRAIAAAGHGPLSVHVGESADEVQFLRDGTGTWRELLGQLGAWSDRWTAPGCRPVEYLDRLGLVTDRLLAVHCVHADDGSWRGLPGPARRS